MTPVDRRILRLAFPALGALAVEPVYVLVDTAIVGRLGTQQLAGLAIAATMLSFIFAGANFLTYGTTERVARRLGAGEPAQAANVGVQAMWLSLLFGVPAAPLLFFSARSVAGWFGAQGAVLDHATHDADRATGGLASREASIITVGADQLGAVDPGLVHRRNAGGVHPHPHDHGPCGERDDGLENG